MSRAWWYCMAMVAVSVAVGFVTFCFFCGAAGWIVGSIPPPEPNATCPNCLEQFHLSDRENVKGHNAQWIKTAQCPRCGKLTDYGTYWAVFNQQRNPPQMMPRRD